MNRRAGNIFFAICLVLVGLLLLLGNLGAFNLRLTFITQWPLILIFIGLSMWAGFFNNRADWGLVIPGTIMLCIGVLFYICANSTSWRIMNDWWPTFILAPGLGLFFAYILGPRNNDMMIPAGILISIALFFLLGNLLNNYTLVLPLLLICIGAAMLILSLLRARAPKQP